MNPAYKPRPGSKTEAAIAYLLAQPDHQAKSMAVCDACDMDGNTVGPILKAALENGWVSYFQVDGRKWIKLLAPALKWKPDGDAGAPEPEVVRSFDMNEQAAGVLADKAVGLINAPKKVVPEPKNLVVPTPSEESLARAQLEASGKQVPRGVDYREVLDDLYNKAALLQNAITSIKALAGLPG